MRNAFYLLWAMLFLVACGSEPESEVQAEKTAPDSTETQLQLGDVIGSVAALGNGFDTKDFDEALLGRGIVLDTGDVRRFGLVKKDYVFDLPESWTVFGMIPTETCVMLFYNYSNTSCIQHVMATYNFDHGYTHVANLELEIHMPPDGSLLPVHARMNDELMITIEYRRGNQAAQAVYKVRSEGKLEKTFYKEYDERAEEGVE